MPIWGFVKTKWKEHLTPKYPFVASSFLSSVFDTLAASSECDYCLSCNWDFYKSTPEPSLDLSGHASWTYDLHLNKIEPYKNILAADWTKPQLLESIMSRSTCAFFSPHIWLLYFQFCQSTTLLVNYLVQMSAGVLCFELIDLSAGKKSSGQ